LFIINIVKSCHFIIYDILKIIVLKKKQQFFHLFTIDKTEINNTFSITIYIWKNIIMFDLIEDEEIQVSVWHTNIQRTIIKQRKLNWGYFFFSYFIISRS
jgi:hypothetical protein